MIRILVLLFQLPTALVILYLDILAVAALFWRRRPPVTTSMHGFAILIPAHDEESLLPRLLESIAALDYPSDLVDVHVVADNCSDRTAEIAAAAGATVHERRDESRQAKGYALQHGLSQLRKSEHRHEAYVFVDADSVLSSNFLRVMNRHLARGDRAVQSYYGVLNQGESWSSALRYAAFALYNGLRPRGRDSLGFSAGLRGNGMCFVRDVLETVRWEAFALAEDVEFHLTLVEAGVRVAYAGEATVLADVPVSLRQAREQHARWERGRLQLLKERGPRLLRSGLLKHDPVRLEALAEQCVPPLSVLGGLTVLIFVLSRLVRSSVPRRLATAVVLGQLGYVFAGLRLVRAKPRVYIALLTAPFYALWKLSVYVLALRRLQDRRWARAPRRKPERLP